MPYLRLCKIAIHKTTHDTVYKNSKILKLNNTKLYYILNRLILSNIKYYSMYASTYALSHYIIN